MCNRSVNFLIRIDKKNRLLFSPLQGGTAKEVLDAKFLNDLNSIAVYVEGEIFIKSTAVLKSLQIIGGFWKIFAVFLIIPSFLRDIIYDIIASMRYTFFGKMNACRIPVEKEKHKFLD